MGNQVEHNEPAPDNESGSLAQSRPHRRNILLPKRYRDIPPQPAPSLPPPELRSPSPSPALDAAQEADTITTDHTRPSLRSRVLHIIRTPRNIFGLARQYFVVELPSVDPEELVTLADMSPLPTAEASSRHSHSKWGPFPNKNSFLLGNWHWNGGLQKSQADFKDLVDIVGDSSFKSEDVRDTKWNPIFAKLGDSDPDESDEEWLDVDAGWKKTSVEIKVPFHRRMEKPGTCQFVAAELHHRSLVEVIKERISDPHTGAQFHLEPYELRWKPTDQHKDVRIHGEIYTSPAFREAHDALQNSPPEPNCNLPRVVVALMFWSDATHLTQFGSSQLWPAYLFMGNESKYRRCKPSCNLCSHVAYFQKVSSPPLGYQFSVLTYIGSYRTSSPTLQPSTLAEKAQENLSSPIVVGSVSTPKSRSLWTTNFLRRGNTV